MGGVKILQLDERVHVDGAFLSEVVVQLGATEGRGLIHDAIASMRAEMEAIARMVASLNAPLTNDPAPAHLADTVAACDRLSRIAWEIGLTTFSGVAVDLALCAERGDMNALRAVAARLQRVGLRSLDAAGAEAAFG